MSEAMSMKARSWLPALGCALLVLAAVGVVHPAGEIPLGDEITYVHTAQTLARTGHITYVGAINAIGGWQLYWGAAAIRLSGPSYLALRWSMAVVAVVVAFLLHRCFVRAGVRPMPAAAGTLTFCLSPLFLSKATTFLTDVPGVLAVVVCLYGCLRALEAGRVRATIFWLGVATIGNSVLGSSRQIPWLGAMVMVPSALWLLRKRRSVVVAGAVLCVLSLAMDGAMQLWFMRQPYTTREPSLLFALSPHRVQMLCLFGLGAVLETGLLLLPVLLVLLPVLWRRRWPRASYLAALGFLVGALGLWRIHALYALEMPYLGPSLRWPLGEGGRIVLTGLIVLGLLALLTTVLTRGDAVQIAADETRLPERSLTGLLVPFLLAYLVALLPRAYNGGLWDRYLLLLAAPLLVWVLRLYQDRVGWPSLLLALCWGVYSTALMHDDFAYERARLGALNQVTARGVPRIAVTGEWPYDVETELQIRPYVTPTGVRLPEGVALPVSKHYGIDDCLGFQCEMIPDVVPKYATTTDAGRALPGFRPVPYRGWVTPSGAFYVTRFP